MRGPVLDKLILFDLGVPHWDKPSPDSCLQSQLVKQGYGASLALGGDCLDNHVLSHTKVMLASIRTCACKLESSDHGWQRTDIG